MKIDDMNNEKPLIYWVKENYIIVTDINVCMCNMILHNKNMGDAVEFEFITIDKTNIYIFTKNILIKDTSKNYFYVLKKKYALFDSVNAFKYVQKIIYPKGRKFQNRDFYDFDKSSQPYPSMRCLIPDEKIYKFEKVIARTNSIIVNLPELVVKRECKKYNLPTTIYTISVSYCIDNNFNKSEEFNVQTYEQYYEIKNLTPCTGYKLKFALSNFYFDQLSINPLDSEVILIKTGELNTPENVSVQALTPTIAVVHWIPPKKLNCVTMMTYKVHWNSLILVNGTQQKGEQSIRMPKRMVDARFFTKIHLSLPLLDIRACASS